MDSFNSGSKRGRGAKAAGVQCLIGLLALVILVKPEALDASAPLILEKWRMLIIAMLSVVTLLYSWRACSTWRFASAPNMMEDASSMAIPKTLADGHGGLVISSPGD